MELFETKEVVRMCAPMVRSSLLSFRQLVRRYNCDLAYTPMIVADSFVKSDKARNANFTTNAEDRPLVVQFAAKNGDELSDAVQLVRPYADAYGLNCGCPQRWAMAEGYGSHLVKNPHLLKDIILQTFCRVPGEMFPCEIKIRLLEDLPATVEMCRQMEHCGVAWISVHGRTPKQRKDPVNYEAIREIKQSVRIPVVANGDIRSEADVARVVEMTGCDGVMVAQGLLNNPAMFAGYDTTPRQCVKDWLDISLSLETAMTTFHSHLIHMLEKWHTKQEKINFNNLQSKTAILDYLEHHHGISVHGC